MRTSLAFAALLLAAPLAGCLSDSSPLRVTGFKGVKVDGDVCSPSGPELTGGGRDSSLGVGYLIGVTIANELPANANSDGRTDSNQAILDTVVTTYAVSDDAEFAAPEAGKLPVSLLIDSSSEGSFVAPLVDAANGVDLSGKNGTLIVTLSLTGHLLDGSSIETTPVTFPISICAGCLAACPAGKHHGGCGGAFQGQFETAACVDD